MTDTQEFDYLKAAQKIAELFPGLAQFDTPENAKISSRMTQCVDLVNTMRADEFFVSLGIALSFNVTQSPSDATLDDVSDAYLGAHPEKKAALEQVVESIEDLKRDESAELIDP